MRKFIFGPVPSKRLGRSLGVDVIPPKTCTLDCKYCQLSSTTNLTSQRSIFFSQDKILSELNQVLAQIEPPNWITFSGTGEPTLNQNLGCLIDSIKALHAPPICVITNSTLLGNKEVRSDLLNADCVFPTLSTVVSGTFNSIHRPANKIELLEILEGLELFSMQYTGRLEIEIFVCPKVNDSKEEISRLKDYLDKLQRVNGIYLNTAVRPSQDPSIISATFEELQEFKNQLNLRIPITTVFDASGAIIPLQNKSIAGPEEIFELLLRHPSSIQQIRYALGGGHDEILRYLTVLKKQGRVNLKPDGIWVSKASSDF